MSEFKFTCIHCSQKLACDPSMSGQRISCPACQRSVLVPWIPSSSSAPGSSGNHGATASDSLPLASADGVPRISIRQISVPEPEIPTGSRRMLSLQGQSDRRSGSGISRLALASFLLALLGPYGCLPALGCGHLARRQMRRHPALRGEELALAGLIIAYTSALFTLVFLLRQLLRSGVDG